MVKKQIKLPAFYFSFEVLLLRITGIELIEKNESFRYRIYSAICFLYAFIFSLSECIEIQYHTDFNTISIIAWYIIMDILTLSKATVIYINRKGIGNLMMSLHEGVYKPNKIRGGEFEEQCIHKFLKKVRSQMTPYGIFVVTSTAAGIVACLTSRLTKSPDNWVLPYFPLSMFDLTRSPNFEIAYVYQSLGGFLYCVWVYMCDGAVISIMTQIVAQLYILENLVRNYTCRRLETRTGEDSASKNLRETIEHHITLLETIEEVERLSSYLVLCVFVANTIMLCLTMYNASLVPIGSIEFVKHFAYSALVAAQTLLYCWWGNEMTLANQGLAMAIYKSYNPDDPTLYAKALKLMLVKAQKPLFFTAGKFVPLSLDTFKGLMKGSFSYFTMLRQVNTK